jgi:hypothetical protein
VLRKTFRVDDRKAFLPIEFYFVVNGFRGHKFNVPVVSVSISFSFRRSLYEEQNFPLENFIMFFSILDLQILEWRFVASKHFPTP